MLGSFVMLVFAAVIALAVGGCVTLPPYDGTALLNHPSMSTDEASIGIDGHVRAVSEGAVGEVRGPR